MNREKLQDALKRVAPALGINVLIPAFRHFRIGDKILYATDGVMAIITNLDESAKIDCSVEGVPFYKLIQSLNKEKISLFAKDDKLIVETTSVEGTFAIPNKESLIDIPTLSDIDFIADFSESIIEAMKFCRFSVSDDETTGAICGIKIGKEYAYSTDRFRVARYKLETKNTIEMILPLKFCNYLLSIHKEISGYFLQDSKFYIELKDGTCAWTSVLIGDFPDLDSYFARDSKLQEVIFPSDIEDTIQRHISFQQAVSIMDQEITLQISKDVCTFVSISPQVGKLKEKIGLTQGSKEDFQMLVNPAFLKEIVNLCSGFYFDSEKHVVSFMTDNLEYIVKTREGLDD